MSNKLEINTKIDTMEYLVNETMDALGAGPVRDAMKLVGPMMKDQLAIMREIVKMLPDENRY